MQDFAIRKPRKQRRARYAVSDLATREHDGERSALGIGQRMDFRRAPSTGEADGLIFLPLLSARSRAMRLHGGGVDENLGGRTAGLGKRLEQIGPHALGGPAHIAVVECFLRPVVGRRIDPATA